MKVKNSKLCYGIGAMGHGLYTAFLGAFLSIYLTDEFGMSGAVMGTMFLVARIWDAVNDPMMGIITDRTNTKWGKYRPYLILTPIVMAVSVIMLFTVPEISETWKIVWAYAFYILYGMSYTAYGVPYVASSYVVTNNTKDRDSYLAISSIIMTACSCAVSIFGLAAIQAFGDGANGYRSTVILLAFIAVLAAWINGFKNREINTAVQQEKNSLQDYTDILVKNKPFQRMLIMNFLIVTAINIPLGVLLYYLKYIVGNEGHYIFIMIELLVIQFTVMSITTGLTRKIGKKQSMMLSLFFMMSGAVLLLVAYQNIVLLYVGIGIIGVGTAILQVSLNILTADTVDYGEWKFGKHSEGVVFSLTSFANKLATAFVGAIIGYGLEIIGYVANQEQTDATKLGLRVLMTMVPVVLELIAILIFRKYELDTATLNQMQKELAERRANQKNA